jgi:hypothetical protein
VIVPVLAAVLAVLVVPAMPASARPVTPVRPAPGPSRAVAHGPTVPDSAYYRAEITAITPTVPGVSARVDPRGEWLEVTDSGPATVIVYGYSDEPYLRLTPTSAEENMLSPATYLNQALFADIPQESSAATQSPIWHPIAATGTARWHDHRIHWMGQSRPPEVAADPGHPHVVGEWQVRARSGDTPFEIHGNLRWIGKVAGPSTVLWIVIALANLPLVIAAFVRPALRRRRAARGRPVVGLRPKW